MRFSHTLSFYPCATEAGHCFPVWSMVYSPSMISSEIGTTVYPCLIMYSKIDGKASGVCSAALWNKTILPGSSRDVTLSYIVPAS